MKRTLLIAMGVCALALAGFAVASLSALKTVQIRSTGFVPRTVTVAGGDTVRWRNVDTVRHQVVANNGSLPPARSCRTGPTRGGWTSRAPTTTTTLFTLS